MVDDDERPTTAVDAHRSRIEESELARDQLGPGTEIRGYVIDGEIGKGGMGFVYSATHPVIGKRAAIKVLKPGLSKSPIVLERFLQEARAVNQIGHPNIVDIFDFGQLPDGRAYHIMDLLVGESLRKRLRRGPLHPSEAASVIDEIACALIAAHDKGFVHRDLKPDNVFLVEHDGRWPEVKLLDFGLTKLMPEAGPAPYKTKTGVMLGTPEYMSPEQIRGVGVDHRTDIYALGVLTFEILAGVRPFPSLGDSILTLQAHTEEPPPSLADLVPTLPVELVQLVAAMLAKEPAGRPSLAAVRAVIKRLRGTLPSRTAAGMEVPSLPPPAPLPGPLTEPAQSSLGSVRASRLGAEPLVRPPEVPTAPLVESVAPSAPGLAVRPRSASNPPPAPAGSGAALPLVGYAPSASTHGRGSGGGSGSGSGGGSGSSPSMPAAPPPARSSPGIRPPGASQPGAPPPAAGLAGAPIAGTVLGVGVPASVKPPALATGPASGGAVGAASPAGAPTPSRPDVSGARPAAPESRTSGVLLVVGALAAIGAGVAIALAVLGLL